MDSFDNNLYLGNEDHNFKQYNQKRGEVTELASALKSTVTYSSENAFLLHEGLHIEDGHRLKIVRANYLIKIKYDQNAQKDIVKNNFEEIEIIGPAVINEINFGWPLEYTYLYKDYNINNLQRDNVWAEQLVNSEVLRSNTQDQKDSSKLENEYEVTPDGAKKNTYTVESASFCCSSNDKNYCIRFKSGPSKTQIQQEDKQYFTIETKSNTRPLSLINGGTKIRPGLLFLGNCRTLDDVSRDNSTTLDYNGAKIYHPPGGEVIIIERKPAPDLFVRSRELYQEFERIGDLAPGEVPLAYTYPYFPSSYPGKIDENHYEFRVQYNNSTQGNFYLPNTFNGYYDESSGHIVTYSVDVNAIGVMGPLTHRLYIAYEDKDFPVDLTPDGNNSNVWVRKGFPTYNHIIYPTRDHCSFSADLNFPQVEVKRLDQNTTINGTNESTKLVQSLCFENTAYSTSIATGDIDVWVRKINKGYPVKDAFPGSLPEDIEDNNLYVQIRLNNFGRFPTDPEKIIKFDVEDLSKKDMIFGEGQDKKEKEYLTYHGKRIKAFGEPELLPSNHYLFDPSSYNSLIKEQIEKEIDGTTYRLRMFKDIGCWDLLTGRLSPLSSIHCFNKDGVDFDAPIRTPRVYVDETVNAEEGFEILLANQPLTINALKANEMELENLFHYLPYASLYTRTGDCIEWVSATGMFNVQFGGRGKPRKLHSTSYSRTAYFVEPDVLKLDDNDQPKINRGLRCGIYGIENSISISYSYQEGLQVTNNTTSYQNISVPHTGVLEEDMLDLPPLSYNHPLQINTIDIFNIEVSGLITLEADPKAGESTWTIYPETHEWYYNGNYMGVFETQE